MFQIYLFRCKGCSAPILLLNTTIDASGDPLRGKPIYGDSIAVVCPHCKHGYRYLADEVLTEQSSSIHDNGLKANQDVWSTTTTCVAASCGEMYRVLTLLDKPSTIGDAERTIHAAASTILCPFGHSLSGQLGLTELFLK
jgi:hypothetical protein